MNAGFSLEKARRQAQANANQTGEPWVLWQYPAAGGPYHVERAATTCCDVLERFEPKEARS